MSLRYAVLFLVAFAAVAAPVHDALPTTPAGARILLDLLLAWLVCFVVEYAAYELRRRKGQTR